MLQVAVIIAVGECFRVKLVALGGSDETFLRQDNCHRLGRYQGGLVDRLGGFALNQWRTTLVSKLVGVLRQLLFDQGFQARLRLEGFCQLVSLADQLILFAADFHFLELGQVTQTSFQDRFHLDIAELEALHQLGFRLVLVTNNAYDFVQVEVNDHQAFENVQPRDHPVVAELQAAPDSLEAELQPLFQQAAQVVDLRATTQADHVQVDAIVSLKIGSGEQVRH